MQPSICKICNNHILFWENGCGYILLDGNRVCNICVKKEGIPENPDEVKLLQCTLKEFHELINDDVIQINKKKTI